MGEKGLFWQQVLVLAKKELLAILKDPKTLRIITIPVLFMGFLFGYAANYNLIDAPYAVVDQSRSASSAAFLSRLDGTSFFKRTMTLDNASEIAGAIDGQDVMLVISIPADFEDKLSKGEPAPIQVITDGRNSMTAGLASGYVSRVVNAYNQERAGMSPPLSLDTRTWYNPNQITQWGFMPGIIGLVSFAQVFLLSGLTVAREREEGTFEQLLVAPVSPTVILIGKAIPPILVGMMQCTILFCISLFWFDVPFAGNYLVFYFALFFYLLSSTGIGLCISSISKNMQQVLVYVFVLMVPMALLSGIVSPVSNMPYFLQILTYADPLRFALELFRRIYLEGAPLSVLAANFVPLSVIAAVTLAAAGYLFRHNMS